MQVSEQEQNGWCLGLRDSCTQIVIAMYTIYITTEVDLLLYRVSVFLSIFMPPLYVRFIVLDMETCMDQQVTDVLTRALLFNIFANIISEKSDGVIIDDLMIFTVFFFFLLLITLCNYYFYVSKSCCHNLNLWHL